MASCGGWLSGCVFWRWRSHGFFVFSVRSPLERWVVCRVVGGLLMGSPFRGPSGDLQDLRLEIGRLVKLSHFSRLKFSLGYHRVATVERFSQRPEAAHLQDAAILASSKITAILGLLSESVRSLPPLPHSLQSSRFRQSL